ncbi:GrpB family protein [Xenorhabdus bovienii]|uniref:GrpB family protein n=1 Tax=Xenorhabdus bovienii TaxID=40576 RepID=A0AAJ1JCA6_XENBV|nr:GrpB family protein [Xenorhabdus bovienii]MDE1480052.1 GrpB family protein [Xenorhabdus bovienii]MDE1485776.1 GrpB family protein [Xenorhabdus bovienii]MDE1491880.1 GrpB family protein [Xenorhabdus bovienii]MDE1495201.1 GrpB family protein [Xenorhabdus bovienii]MDE9473181.1 GrpB family protein [Xenorhabdus bovienii]
MINPKDIIFFPEPDPNENPWVHGKPAEEVIGVVAYNPEWVATWQQLSESIKKTLGNIVLHIEHVGSTAVPGLAAKPVIDIDLIVLDPIQEQTYVPALEQLGYDLTVREPSFYQHRCLRLAKPRVNLHVFGPDCPEHIRHILFRDWLREHPEDCQRYMAAKINAKDNVSQVMHYNQRKEQVVREIYQRIFQIQGLLS